MPVSMIQCIEKALLLLKNNDSEQQLQINVDVGISSEKETKQAEMR